MGLFEDIHKLHFRKQVLNNPKLMFSRYSLLGQYPHTLLLSPFMDIYLLNHLICKQLASHECETNKQDFNGPYSSNARVHACEHLFFLILRAHRQLHKNHKCYLSSFGAALANCLPIDVSVNFSKFSIKSWANLRAFCSQSMALT